MSSSAITGPILSDVRRSPSGSAAAPSWSFADSTGTGVYLVSADVLALSTAGVQRVVVDASGYVGIGTASPRKILEVRADAGINAIQSQDSADSTNFVRMYSDAAFGATINSNTGSAIRFAHSSENFGSFTERMRIDASGNLFLNRTSAQAGETLGVKAIGTLAAWFHQPTNTSGYHGIATGLQPNGGNTSSYHFWGNTNSVGNWYLYGNGTSSFSSDERLKKNIETTRDGYLQDVCKLRVVKYNWKHDEEGKPKELGLIAQEVEQVFPGLVQDDLNPVEEGGELYKQLKASVLPFMLLKAIQEQQAMIEELKAKVSALESK